jgi:MtfA peptidase
VFARIIRWLARQSPPEPDSAKRDALRAQPFPENWLRFVAEVPQTRALTSVQRAKLHGDIQVFLGEKDVLGEEGFPLDDRTRVIVAATACLLVLGRDIALFDHVRRVIIRPRLADDVGGLYQRVDMMLVDEVLDRPCLIVLGRNAIVRGLEHEEGENTIMHEFAHALDDADGRTDALQDHEHYEKWSAFLHEFPLHHRVVGDYIVTSVVGDARGPELFASATELFFECPRKLRRFDADLFDELCTIYSIDPRSLTRR